MEFGRLSTDMRETSIVKTYNIGKYKVQVSIMRWEWLMVIAYGLIATGFASWAVSRSLDFTNVIMFYTQLLFISFSVVGTAGR